MTKIFDPMEGDIVGIVIRIRPIDCCAAEVDNIVALNLEIRILKPRVLRVPIPSVKQIADHLPVEHILRRHQRKQVSVVGVLHGGDPRGDAVVSACFFLLFKHKLRVIGRKFDGYGGAAGKFPGLSPRHKLASGEFYAVSH